MTPAGEPGRSGAATRDRDPADPVTREPKATPPLDQPPTPDRVMSLLSEAISAISHDVQSRLISIRGFADLLGPGSEPIAKSAPKNSSQANSPDSETRREEAGAIEAGADAGADAESVLAIQRNAVAAQRQLGSAVQYLRLAIADLRPAPVDVGSLVAKIAATARASGTPAPAVEGDLAPAIADPEALHRVLHALIDSALASPTRTQAAAGEPVSVRISCERGAHANTYTVADDGAPIDPVLIAKAFRDVCGSRAGTGIEGARPGLAEAYLLITRMGGEMWAEPDSGDARGRPGARLSFILPADEANDADG